MYSSLTRKTHIYKRLAAFTLLEMTIVIAIIGVIVAGGLAVLTVSTQTSLYNATTARMDQINKALLDYTVAFGRLPCPSNLTLTSTNTNYGVEAASNNNTCTGLTPAANFTSSTGAAEGGVPTRTLKLPDNYMYDGWGRRFRYAVDPAQTASGAFPPAMGSACGAGYASAITVKDASGAARTTAAAYVLISHGANGHGAYTSNGVVFNAGSVNSDEQTNCHCDNTGTSTTYTGTYVEKLPTTTTTTNDTGIFDDVVTFREAWQMQSPNSTLSTAPKCVLVNTRDDNNIQLFNSATGSYSGILAGGNTGAYGSGPGQFSFNNGLGNAINIDSNGNLWAADCGNNRVQELSGTGSYIGQIGCSGTGACSGGSANGQVTCPIGVAADPSNNIWVVDFNNQRVEKFSNAGTYLLSIGSGYQSVGGTIGSSGSLNGQFNFSYSTAAITTDSSGNIWVTDQGNNRVQKFSNTGTFLLGIGSGYQGVGGSIGATGSTAGKFNSPSTTAIDSSGNAWVCDGGNSRVQEFSSSGVYIGNFGGTACYGGNLINIDKSGNFWLANNGGVGEFSALGASMGVGFSAVDSGGHGNYIGGVTFSSR